MNYFRCTVGGGKGNTVTVTCAEEFAGLTITLAKTGKTYTKTCPSTAPYTVTYYGVENGTYTVSCTVDGQTYSETVVVQDISCVLNYGFTWRLWVDTASQLDSSDYDTLDEVLADEKALRELFLEHACVDYMASVAASNEDLETVINDDYCAKWINNSDYALDFLGANTVIKALMDEANKYGYGEWALVGQVPTMTSNTAPYGEVIFNGSNYNAFYPYYAFDGTDTEASRWAANLVTFGDPCYIGYHFTSPVKLGAIKIKFIAGITSSTCQVQASNDGTDWADIGNSVNIEPLSDDLIPIASSQSYEYYRVYITNQTQTTARLYSGQVQTLQFYAWAPKGNVPVMTANNAPYGEASGSSVYNSSHPYYYAFDGSDSTTWASSMGMSARIAYKFSNPVSVKGVVLYSALTTSDPNETAQLVYSDDGTTFTPTGNSFSVNHKSGSALVKTEYKADIEDEYHLIWGVIYTSTANASHDTASLQFYGRELKVSVPVMTSNTAPYGVASMTATASNSHEAWYAFDNSDSTYASGSLNTNIGLSYDFTKKVVIKAVKIYSTDSRLGSFKVQGSNDGSDWTDLFSGTISSATETYFNEINNETEYRHYRLYALTAGSGQTGYIRFYTIQFYGLDYSEKEFEAGTTKKWLYDHGVELEELVYGSSVEKEDSQIVCIGNSSDALKSVVNTLNIDLTPYNLIRVVLGNRIVPNSGNNNCGSWFVSNQDNIQWNASTFITYKDIPVVIDNPNTFNLDISSVNASKKFGVGTAANADRRNSFKELWLE